ncbi:MAG: integrase arm-type DNA-binding domain-containing protein [Negativicutes bacterium]|nr:integrase arm-type DNA-binding domain-containing protein [Negativicutes bacterium]
MLTTKEIDHAKPQEKLYRIFDALGLYVEIHPSGHKYWRLKYHFFGKEKRLAIGKYPQMTLLEAREKREQARKLLADNIDPATEKKDRRNAALANLATTFELVAREWHENHKERWTPEYAEDILHRLDMDIFPQIGKLPIADIKPIQVLDALRRIENRGAHEMARRSMQYCGQVFRYAVITERCDRDVTADLRGALKPFRKGHYKAIEADDLPDFLNVLLRNEARLYPQTMNAMRLMLLTFVRTSELIEAKWEEFNFDTKEWIIPAERMKMRRPHIVPLARQTIEILQAQKKLTGKWEWVFANVAYPKKHMSNGTLLGALKRLGYTGRMTGHGFRALAMSTIKEKLDYRHEVVDRQLAHAPANKVDAAYDRAKFLDERRKMMQEWADYLDNVAQTGKVIHVNFSEAAE